MKLRSSLFFTSFTILHLTYALGQNRTVAFISSEGALKLAGNGNTGQILVSANENWGVQRAAEDLATDFGKVTGANLTFAAQGVQTTAPIYTYRPPTSNVNVSRSSTRYSNPLEYNLRRLGQRETYE